MKQKLKTILKAAVILAIVFWVLSKIPFNRKINQEIPANIYQEGVVIGETAIIMDGEKSNYLFTEKESYSGKFQILSYEKTGRDNMNAHISWGGLEKTNIQQLIYTTAGIFPDMDLVSFIIINEAMTQFALMFKDGTVIATSDGLYELYTQNITYYPDTGAISARTIPKI